MTDLLSILESIGYTNLTDFGKQYSTRPLYRNSDNNLALTINKNTGEWYDFVERIGGSLETLIEKTLGRPLTDDLKRQIETSNIFQSRSLETEVHYEKVFDKKLLLKLEKDHSYWNKRNISSETLKLFNGGVAINGRLMNRYVFPIFNERKDLVGFSGRYLWAPKYVPKWKHIGKKSNWIFPVLSFDDIIKLKEAVIVESIGDMLALYENNVRNVLVSFGVKINPEILKTLLKFNVKNIHIGFNNDSHNKFVGNRAAEDCKRKLLGFFNENQVHISLPKDKNDFGDMSREEIEIWKMENLKRN